MHGSISRHDLQLAVIILPLVLAGVFGAVSSLATSTVLAMGSVPASSGAGYALPTDPR